MKHIIIFLLLFLSNCSLSVKDTFLENIKGTYKKDKKTFTIDGESIASPSHGLLQYYGSRYTTEGIYYRLDNKKYLGIQITYSNNIKILSNSNDFPKPENVSFTNGSHLFGIQI